MHAALPAILCLLTTPALADQPRAIGRFGDWVAATHQEDGRTVCYAFTRAIVTQTDPTTEDAEAQQAVVLSVAERPTERDDVAISVGFTLRRNQPFALDLSGRRIDFYTAQRAAFARDGSAAVAALSQAQTAADQTQGPHASPVADQFSLRGFPAAYAAITRACPED